MKIVEVVDPMSKGGIAAHPVWLRAWQQVKKAIEVIDWPHGSGRFLLNPGKISHCNGVMPIKVPCIGSLVRSGWNAEGLPRELAGVQMGNLDALLQTKLGAIGFEWETGNISSSHRAVNKIIHAMIKGGLLGGFLVVACQEMRRYLTDRIGNITELRPYFPVWEAVQFERGVLRVVAVTFDELSPEVPFIPKQMDGNAFRVRRPPRKRKSGIASPRRRRRP